MLKMLDLIGPDELVNRGFVNFQKMVWMTTVYICAVFGKGSKWTRLDCLSSIKLELVGLSALLIHYQSLHTLALQGMQNISGFVTNSILICNGWTNSCETYSDPFHFQKTQQKYYSYCVIRHIRSCSQSWQIKEHFSDTSLSMGCTQAISTKSLTTHNLSEKKACGHSECWVMCLILAWIRGSLQ